MHILSVQLCIVSSQDQFSLSNPLESIELLTFRFIPLKKSSDILKFSTHEVGQAYLRYQVSFS